MIPSWVFVAALVSVLAGTVQLLTYFRAERRWRLGIAISRHRHQWRDERRREQRAEWHDVQVEGGRHSLGSSVESPTEMSGSPELTTEETIVVAKKGARLRILPGKTMRVLSLPGARRAFLEAMTTTGGVQQRFSFEVDPDVAFKILGIASGQAAARPFRDTPAIDLQPFDGAYVIGKEADEGPPGEPSAPGCGGRRATFAIFGLGFVGAIGPFVHHEVGLGLWGVPIVLAGLWSAAQVIEALDPPRLDREHPEVANRVRAELGWPADRNL